MRNFIICSAAFLCLARSVHSVCPPVNIVKYGLGALENRNGDVDFFERGMSSWAAEKTFAFSFADDFVKVAKEIGKAAGKDYQTGSHVVPIGLDQQEEAAYSKCTYFLITPVENKFLVSFHAQPN